jgi:hypothetical protein
MERQKYTLIMEEKADCLCVHASGIRSRDTVLKLTLKVFNAALEKHLSKVLLDVRKLTGNFGFIDIYYLVTQVFEDLRGKGVDQAAVVDIRQTLGQGWFLETVAQSHGLNLRVFAEEESAIKWLELWKLLGKETMLVVKNIGEQSGKEIPFPLDKYEGIGNSIWSPDERRMVFSKFQTDADGKLMAWDYLILDTETGSVVPFRENEPVYINFRLITNDIMVLSDTTYSLDDGSVVEWSGPAVPAPKGGYAAIG